MPDKIVLVTGGSRGIGAATSRLAARKGWAVAVNFKSDEKAAQGVVKTIQDGGGKAVAIQADMAKESDIARMFEEVDKKLGRLTDLVYNSGITGKASRFEAVSTATLQEVMDVNVMGAFWCARAAIPRISTKNGGPGGSIVLLSSVAATLGGVGEYVWYAASKGAIDTLNIGLSKELATEGIRVNAVSPGPVDTEIHEPGRLDRIISVLPMGRAATPDEIAESVVFLMSEASSFTTGANLRVAGGR